MEKKKKITGDLLYSITAVGLMNAVLQFIVYPVVNNKIGANAFGEMLFYLGVLSVLAPSFGIAVNNTRLLLQDRDKAKNKDFIYILFIFSLVSALVSFAISIYRKNSVLGMLFFVYIVVITIFRNYSNVEYRLRLDYKKQFIFYMILSVGYIIGLGLFLLMRKWELIYIIGETAAVFYVVIGGQIYTGLTGYSDKKHMIIKNSSTLAVNYLITNLMLNLDRMVLLNFVGEEAVSQYYVLSLMGKTIAIISGPLNGILIGYLTKDGKKLSKKSFFNAGGIMLVVGAVFLLGCVIITPFYMKIMYPNLYGDIISLNVIVNMGQIFYFLAGILVVVSLTVCTAKKILYAQMVYSVTFIVLSVIFTMKMGISGFSYAALISNMLYFILVYFAGFRAAR